jgi:hypothetical protein
MTSERTRAHARSRRLRKTGGRGVLRSTLATTALLLASCGLTTIDEHPCPPRGHDADLRELRRPVPRPILSALPRRHRPEPRGSPERLRLRNARRRPSLESTHLRPLRPRQHLDAPRPRRPRRRRPSKARRLARLRSPLTPTEPKAANRACALAHAAHSKVARRRLELRACGETSRSTQAIATHWARSCSSTHRETGSAGG